MGIKGKVCLPSLEGRVVIVPKLKCEINPILISEFTVEA
jgi:hypothetical protein